MNKMLSKKASAWALAGAASLVAAFAATTAIADSEDPVPTVSVADRADAYLQATQRELRASSIAVSSIALAGTRDGVDYYALRGDEDHCILSASSGKPAGASDSLACAPNDSAKPLGVPITDAGSRTVGFVFWTDGGSLSVHSSDSPALLTVTAADPISFVDLAAPGEGLSGAWTSRSGETATLSVKSAAESQREIEERVAVLRRR